MRILAIAALAISLCVPPAFGQPITRPGAGPRPPVQAMAAPSAPAPAAASGATLERAFAGYIKFQSELNVISRGFSDAASVDAALDSLARYNATELAQGFIAYAALIAAGQPTFAAEAKKVLAAYGPDIAGNGFATNGAYALSLNGAASARDLALAAAALDGARINALGEEVRGMAGRLRDGSSWGNTRVRATRDARLARLRGLFAETTPFTIAPGGPAGFGLTPLIWTGAAPTPAGPAGPLSAPADQVGVVEAIMSLAALQAIGAVERMSPADREALLSQPDLVNCFERARLQLVQCVSAGEFLYENAACIGEAGLQTRGACIAKIAGGG